MSSGIWTSCLAQGTIYASGTFTGSTTWSADTIKVTGSVSVDTLIIEPGTVVEFQGKYGLWIEKYLNAQGEMGDTILFTVNDTTGLSDPDALTGSWGGITGWGKIVLNYCKIQYVKHPKTAREAGAVVSLYNSLDIRNSCIANNITNGIYKEDGISNICNSLITDNHGQGVKAERGVLKVHDCIVRNNPGGGISQHEGKLFLDNSSIETNGIYGIRSSESYMLYLNNNRIQNNNGIGIKVHDLETPWRGIVSNNIIKSNNGYGFDGDICGIQFVNNLIFSNKNAGIRLNMGYGSGSILVNNTIINNSNGIKITDAPIYMYNCICRENNAREGEQNISSGNPEEIVHGEIYNSNIDAFNPNDFSGEFVNNMDTDPQFVDTTNFDFHLSDYSPCINSGMMDTTGLNLPEYDLDGNPRVFDGRIDMGAFEYQHDNFHILKQPVSQVICAGAAATLETDAIGGVVGYQWQKNGIDIPSANQGTLIIDPVMLNDSGYYHCLIISDDKTVSTDTIILSVDTGINIESQSHSFSICPGKDTLIYVTVSCGNRRTYSWTKNDTLLPDATEPELMIPSPAIQQQDIYLCAISNACGAVLSEEITVTASNIPDPPVSNDITICEGQPVPVLDASGEHVKWYSDAELTNLIFSGSHYNTGLSDHGLYVYYVNQTVSGCESAAGMIRLTINSLPVISLGKDSTISSNQNFMLGPYTNTYSYLWNNHSENPYFEISGNDLGPGSHTISVVVTDTNTCRNSDTMIVVVVPYTNISMTQNNNLLRIYPNPTGGLINIEVSDLHDEDVIIKLFNQQSEEIFSDKINVENRNGTIQLNITSLPTGIYYLQIIQNNRKYSGKVVRQ